MMGTRPGRDPDRPRIGRRSKGARALLRIAATLLLFLPFAPFAIAAPGSPAAAPDPDPIQTFETIDPFADAAVPSSDGSRSDEPTLDRFWRGLGGGMDGDVYALVVWNGDLVAGGDFTTAGGKPAANIARWDGAAWHALGAGTDGPVEVLVVWNGALVAGGSFGSAGAASAANLARWGGSSWSALGGTDGPVRALAVHDGALVVGGSFGLVAGALPAANVAVRSSGGGWTALGSGTDGAVTALASFGGEIVAGGEFLSAGGTAATRIARWNGAAWTPLVPASPSIGFDAPVRTLLPGPLSLWIGGEFTELTGSRVTCLYLTRWFPSGSILVPSQGPNAAVRALAWFDGQVAVGGDFTRVRGVPVRYFSLARAGAGLAWEYGRFGPNAPARALVDQDNGLTVGGLFTSTDNKPAMHIARWACDAPLVPTGVAATNHLCGRVRVTWNDREVESGYRVYRNGALIGTVGQNVTTFDDMGAPVGSNPYTVEAFNGCGDSPRSAVASGSPRRTAAPPASFTASNDDCTDVQLSWSAVATADNYRILRDGGTLVVLPSTETSYVDHPPRGSHEYQVQSGNGCGWSAGRSATGTALPPPSPPSTITASDTSCAVIVVSWSAAAGAGGYELFRDGTSIATLAPSVLSYVDTPPAGVHEYGIAAQGECGTGDQSTTSGRRLAAPPAPERFTASDTSCAAVYLSWSVTPDAGGYRLYRDGDLIATLDASKHGYVDERPPGVYVYTIEVPNACGVSPSRSASGGVPPVSLPASATLTASRTRCAGVALGWTAVPWAVGYDLYRDGAKIAALSATTLAHTDDVGPGTYRYAVIARGLCGSSDSAAADGAVAPPNPGPVTELTASDSLCSMVRLAWTAPSGADSVRIRRDDHPLVTLPAGLGSWNDTTATAAHVYSVVARSACGLSSAVSATGGVRPAAPDEPAFFAASDSSCRFVRLDWSAAPRAEGYQLRRNGVTIATLGAGVHSFEDEAGGGAHLYEIAAENGCGESRRVQTVGNVLSPPSPPVVFTASDTSCAYVRLGWTAGGDADSVILFRDGARIAAFEGAEGELFDRAYSGTHKYEAIAANRCGLSEPVTTAGRVLPGRPRPPSSIHATDDRCDSLVVTWTDLSDDEIGFDVLRDGESVIVTGPNVTRYADRPSPGVHEYEVRAFGACGITSGGLVSGERLAPPETPVPALPAEGAAMPGGAPILFAWNAAFGADEYRLQVAMGDDGDFAAPLVDARVLGASYEMASPPIGVYRWRVAAVAGCGSGDFATARRFTREAIEGFALSERNVGFGYDPLAGPSGSDIPDPDPDVVVIVNDGEVPFRWWTTPSSPWIHVDPDTGALGPGEGETLWVAVLANQLLSGEFDGEVLVRTDLTARPEDTLQVGVDVKSYPLGDCNGDGVLDERDVAALVDHVIDRLPLWAPVLRLGLPDVDFDDRVDVLDLDGLPPIIGTSLLGDRPGGAIGTGDETVLWVGLGPDSFVVSLEGTGLIRAGAVKLRVPAKSAPAFTVRALGEAERADVVQDGNQFVLLFHNRGESAPVLGGEKRIDLAVLKWGDGPEPEIAFEWGGTAPDGADRNPIVRAEFYRLGGPGSRRFAFFPIRPNPFSRECLVSFELPSAAPVSIRAYNPAGRLVRTLLSGDHPAGVHTYVWDGRTDDGREAGDGLYFLKLESPRGTVVRRSVIVR